MFPSGLQEIFGTLSVGLLCVAIFACFYWLKENVEDGFLAWYLRHDEWRPSKEGVILPLVFFFSIYSVGMIVENQTDGLTDSERGIATFWPPWPMRLHSEAYHRTNAFFFDSKPVASGQCLQIATLGIAVFGDDDWRRSVGGNPGSPYGVLNSCIDKVVALGADGPVAQDCVKFSRISDRGRLPYFHCKISDDQLGSIVNTYYYRAKNWAYQQPTYYEELVRIQQHVDFSRSALLVSSWSIFPLLLAGQIAFWRSFHSKPSDDNATAGEQVRSRWRVIRRSMAVFVTLSLASYVTHGSWLKAELNFNERALGYYLTARPPSCPELPNVQKNRLQLLNSDASARSVARPGNPALHGTPADRLMTPDDHDVLSSVGVIKEGSRRP